MPGHFNNGFWSSCGQLLALLGRDMTDGNDVYHVLLDGEAVDRFKEDQSVLDR